MTRLADDARVMAHHTVKTRPVVYDMLKVRLAVFQMQDESRMGEHEGRQTDGDSGQTAS
ncbi:MULTISPECIES: hypothetical protein [Haloferax]|uniref:Uncharacterized protein n=1 Tax=Haloferax marinisediminis TaxID=2666142 RepID=A0A6G1YYY0_9EURY|nr:MULTISPECIES: hypothetical protein [Haloferax]MRW79445.1 hypothetical protein [Haloferax marinisediminis]